MDIKKIKSLIELLENSQLTAIDVEDNGTKIRIERNITAQPVALQHIQAPAPAVSAETVREIKTDGVVDYNNLHEVKAPLVGIFYSSAAPEAKPFVCKGSKVKKGDVLCIIEAMKVMNEIAADKDGEIIDICVNNGQIVEYSQVLFKIQ